MISFMVLILIRTKSYGWLGNGFNQTRRERRPVNGVTGCPGGGQGRGRGLLEAASPTAALAHAKIPLRATPWESSGPRSLRSLQGDLLSVRMQVTYGKLSLAQALVQQV